MRSRTCWPLDDTVGAGGIGRYLRASLSGVLARKTVIIKEVAQTGLVSGYVGAPSTACAC